MTWDELPVDVIPVPPAIFIEVLRKYCDFEQLRLGAAASHSGGSSVLFGLGF